MAAQESAITTNVGNVYSDIHALAAASKSNHTTSYQPLNVGALGTFQTLDAMAQAVRGEMFPDRSGWSDNFNQQVASALCYGQPDEIAALFFFVRDHIEYQPHPWNMQVIQDCRRTIELKTADCVSKSVCLATLLACRGIISRFVAQAPDGEEHDHVYVEVIADDDWLALDPTADGCDGRPLGSIGWRQQLPDLGFESTGHIFGRHS